MMRRELTPQCSPLGHSESLASSLVLVLPTAAVAGGLLVACSCCTHRDVARVLGGMCGLQAASQLQAVASRQWWAFGRVA
jgi:hypothetical protein